MQIKDKNKYFEPLTGFRGLAAISILLFHSLFPCFRALWIGVPMFFVLSGFLITRILIKNKLAKNYLKVFYFKRALRIFPIYYLALLFSILWGVLVHNDISQLPYFIFYLQNFTISQNILPDYCNGIMNHTWSLSVEELFYLFWPFIVLVLNRKALVATSILIGTSCIFYKLIMITFYYKVQTDQLLMLSLAGNVDGLMAGSFLGILSLNKESFIYTSFSTKTLALSIFIFTASLAANYWIFFDSKLFSYFKFLLNQSTIVASFYTIAWIISEKENLSFCFKIFNSSFLQLTGKISYGLYLYHAIIYALIEASFYHFKINVNPIFTLLLKIIITYIVSITSWYLIEKPFLRLKDRNNYKFV